MCPIHCASTGSPEPTAAANSLPIPLRVGHTRVIACANSSSTPRHHSSASSPTVKLAVIGRHSAPPPLDAATACMPLA